MFDDWNDRYGEEPVRVDERARRLTVPPGALNGVNYARLSTLVRERGGQVRLRQVLTSAHGCRLGDTCNACVDTAVLTMLEAEGWTIVRQETSPPDGVAS